MPTLEANFDGLVGPTHNYAGLSPGNLASEKNSGAVSRPRAAALQGIEKAWLLASMGVPQYVFPPQDRPDVSSLRGLGFTGTDADVLAAAAREAPAALNSACSASAMWAANAATVSPSADTADGRLHFTAANLAFNRHRSLEAGFTTRVLRTIFNDESRFAVHEPLMATPRLFDEGAANHTRLTRSHADAGVELLAYGRPIDASSALSVGTRVLPARQAEEASRAIARLHGLDLSRVVFARQHPLAIDAGVFHNDVISVGNEDVLIAHEVAYQDTAAVIDECRAKLDCDLSVFLVSTDELSLEDAVATYFFNSMLVTDPASEAGAEGRMTLIAPVECEEHAGAHACVQRLVDEVPAVGGAVFVDVRESMRNGGGPACLRLRVVMTDAERAAVGEGVRLTEGLRERLIGWVERHYREELLPRDLGDPSLLVSCRDALDELTGILGLGALYDFQR